MLMRVTLGKQENHLEVLGGWGGGAVAENVSDGAIVPSSRALAPPLI